jgi:hypothetical protein
MSDCHCRPGGPMCLLHFGQLSRRERDKIRRKMGLRK